MGKIKTVEECEICIEKYNKRNRKKVTCPFNECSKTLCAECFITFLKETGLSPVCMWCKKDLSLEFINENISKVKYKEYVNYRTDIQLEMAQRVLPEVQERANQILRERKVNKIILENIKNGLLYKYADNLNNIKNMLSKLFLKFNITMSPHFKVNYWSFKWNKWEEWLTKMDMRCVLCDMFTNQDITCKTCNFLMCNLCMRFFLLINETRCIICNSITLENDVIKQRVPIAYYNKFFKRKRKSKTRIQDSHEFIETASLASQVVERKLSFNNKYSEFVMELYHIKHGTYDLDRSENSVKSQFIKKCLDNKCRGFLSTQWKCGLCNKNFCKDCHALKYSSHECDENEKATVALIKTDSKPCPQCGAMIHRYTGCSQVWTPCCKIAFNWKTGLIEKGRIHSPEYYDYIRRTNNGVVPREVGDEPCGGNVNFYRLSALFLENTRETKTVAHYHQVTSHFENHILPQLPREVGRLDFSNLGLQYLLGDITKEDWRSKLKKMVKKNEKDNHLFNILNMFVNVMNDFFRNVIENKDLVEFIKHADQLIDYTNEHVNKIQKMYGSKDKQFNIVVLRIQ